MKLLSILVLIAVLAVAFGATLRGITTDDAYDGYEVQQIHIAQGRDPTAMTISWVTKDPAGSVVRFGRTPESMKTIVSGNSSTYKFDYPDYGLYESGTIHHVSLTGLTADTIYFYQCGDAEQGSMSGVLNFRTVHGVGSKVPMHFGVIGDLGQTVDSESTLRHMIQNDALSMILHAGDLSYADCQQTLWDSYGQMIEDLAKERCALVFVSHSIPALFFHLFFLFFLRAFFLIALMF